MSRVTRPKLFLRLVSTTAFFAILMLLGGFRAAFVFAGFTGFLGFDAALAGSACGFVFCTGRRRTKNQPEGQDRKES